MNIQEYSIALMTITDSNKNSSAVAREIGIHQSTTSKFLKKLDINDKYFTPYIQKMFGKKPLNLVIDDGTIAKRYSQIIEGTSSMIDQSTKTFTRGYKIVLAGLTDGFYFLPISLEQWIAEFIMGNQYKTVTQLAEKLILRLKTLEINIKHYVFDGLYFSESFIYFLNNQGLHFTIKAKTTTSVFYKGKKIQLQECNDLKLKTNQSTKKIIAEWNGKPWYFIAVKRYSKRGETTIYLIANFNKKSKIYKHIYDSRWAIEKCFRTTKQFLGLKNSSSRFAHIYLNHIKCVIFAYCHLQILMKKFKLKSIEDTIRKVQSFRFKNSFDKTVDQFSLLEKIS